MDSKQGLSQGNLKILDLNNTEFEANGVKYYIEKHLSFERFLMYKKLELQVGYEVGFYGIFQTLKKIYELCNDKKFADIAVLTHNTMQGITKIDERRIPVLDLAALFINEKDEDRKVINDDMIAKKIDNWQAEGLSIMPFFQLSTAFIKDFQKVYNEIILISSGMTEEEK